MLRVLREQKKILDLRHILVFSFSLKTDSLFPFFLFLDIFLALVQGFISAEMCKEQLPAASDDTIAFMCGPPAMIKFACIPNLTANGYSSTSHFNF